MCGVTLGSGLSIKQFASPSGPPPVTSTLRTVPAAPHSQPRVALCCRITRYSQDVPPDSHTQKRKLQLHTLRPPLPVLHGLQGPPSQVGVEQVGIHLHVGHGGPVHL